MDRFALPKALIILLALTSGPIPASAQVTKIGDDADETPPTYKMTVCAAHEPQPALKYRFLVPPVDQIRGDAANYYYKAMAIEGVDLFRVLSGEQRLETWLESPLDKFPHQEVLKDYSWLESWSHWAFLAKAARCESCDWEDNISDLGAYTLLPHAQKLRSVARALALRSRLQIAQERTEDAIETLRMGYALSRHLGQGETLVQNLIGMAIQGMLDDQTRTLIATDRSPNLYWALTDLADQPIDLRRALSFETKVWEFTIHELADIGSHPLTAEEASKLSNRVWSIVGDMGAGRSSQEIQPPMMVLWTMQLYPLARSYLLRHGHDVAKLDEMPVLQVVLLYRWRQYEELRDDYFKWTLLPDEDARQVLRQGQNNVEARIETGFGMPFSEALPTVRPSIIARLRFQRQTDLLRTIEALRMHAAEHGDWPKTLADVTVAPVPRDPYTNNSFVYSVSDGVASLVAPPIPSNSHWAKSGAARHELTLRPQPSTK